MLLRRWEDLPDFMRISEVRPYWEILNRRKIQLFLKRIFDIVVAIILLVVLTIPMILIAIWIKIDSPGPAFYRQERVTTCGKHFRIHKFRTMVFNAEQIGSCVTVDNDIRITKVGKKLRRLRLDELPQLIDILTGMMSFVGVRPEVVKYVEQYKPEYNATLLLPAGVTSLTSIYYKNEAELLNSADNPDKVYIDEVLPEKMRYNLKEIREFSLVKQIKIMVKTLGVVITD